MCRCGTYHTYKLVKTRRKKRETELTLAQAQKLLEEDRLKMYKSIYENYFQPKKKPQDPYGASAMTGYDKERYEEKKLHHARNYGQPAKMQDALSIQIPKWAEHYMEENNYPGKIIDVDTGMLMNTSKSWGINELTNPQFTPSPTKTMKFLKKHNDWTIALETSIDGNKLIAFNSTGQTVRSKEMKLILDGKAFHYYNNQLFSGVLSHDPAEHEVREAKEREEKEKAEAKRQKEIEAIGAYNDKIDNKIEKLHKQRKPYPF